MSSKVITVKSPTSDKTCSPCYNSEIWLPITYPTISSTLKIQVWDSDEMAGPELVATYKCDMERINATDDRAYFANLYGAHVEPVKNVLDLDGLAQEAAETYNVFPDLDESRAPAYRGRLLLKHRLENEIPRELFQSDLQAR